MYLHIGNGKSVKKKDIIGIFDLDTSTVTKAGKDFINKSERAGRVEYDDDDLPRSFVLVEEDNSKRSTCGLALKDARNDVWQVALAARCCTSASCSAACQISLKILCTQGYARRYAINADAYLLAVRFSP